MGTDARDSKGRFLKGRKGGPGRPPGRAEKYRAVLESRAAEILEVWLTQALAAEPQALRMAVERLIPLQAIREADLLAEIAELQTKITELQAELETRKLRRVA